MIFPAPVFSDDEETVSGDGETVEQSGGASESLLIEEPVVNEDTDVPDEKPVLMKGICLFRKVSISIKILLGNCQRNFIYLLISQ